MNFAEKHRKMIAFSLSLLAVAPAAFLMIFANSPESSADADVYPQEENAPAPFAQTLADQLSVTCAQAGQIFTTLNTPAPVQEQVLPDEPAPAAVEGEVQTVSEEQTAQGQPIPEESAPAETYTEPVYEEPVYVEETYTEPVYEEPVYVEETYTEPVYEEPVYVEETYTEPVYEEPVYAEETYTEPVYEEPVYVEETYTEPVYEEPVYVEETYTEPMYEEPVYVEETYTEPVYEEPVYVEETYTEPVYEEPVYVEETYTEPVYEEPVYVEEPYTEPVYEEPAADPYADLNAAIAQAALELVGTTDGLQCTEVATLALQNAGVENALEYWPNEYQEYYGYYTDDPQAGNLIFYDNGGNGVDHIAVYIGDGQAVHGNYITNGESHTVIAPAELESAGTPQYIQVEP